MYFACCYYLRSSLFLFWGKKILMIDFTVLHYIPIAYKWFHQKKNRFCIATYRALFCFVEDVKRTKKRQECERELEQEWDAHFHFHLWLCCAMKWCMLLRTRFGTSNGWWWCTFRKWRYIAQILCSFSHNGVESSHYFILSFCGITRLCYGDNGFLLYLHRIYVPTLRWMCVTSGNLIQPNMWL